MYVPSDEMRFTTNATILNWMGFHPATEETRPIFEANRHMFIGLAQELNATIPEGREKTLMFTALHEALMWANAAVALSSPLEEQ